MIILFSVVMALLLIVGFAKGGVIIPLAVTWLIAAMPITLGIIEYNFYLDIDISFELMLTSYVIAFVFGVFIVRTVVFPKMRQHVGEVDPAREIQRLNFSIVFCGWAGLLGSIFLLIDFFINRGGSLSNLAELRSNYSFSVAPASIFGKLASVLTWACLYCFIVVFYYWSNLTIKFRLYLFVPIVGYFLTSLLSAGRQAAYQIVIVSVLIMAYRVNTKSSSRGGASRLVFAVLLCSTLVSYMGFIAIVRNDAAISADKREVLRLLFDYRMSDTLYDIEQWVGPNISTFIEEVLTYFTAQIVLFRTFLEVGISEKYYGVFTFPFLLRQIEGITGVSVIGALIDKTVAMDNAGVISTGWTTAISAYIQDFGIYGAYPFLALLGGYSEYTWKKARTSGDFHDFTIMILMMMSAFYMPMVPASSDTNLLFLWMYCLIVRFILTFRSPSQRQVLPGSRRGRHRHGEPMIQAPQRPPALRAGPERS